MKIKVFYPSGKNFSLSGEWKGPGQIDGNQCILIISDSEFEIPDSAPRRVRTVRTVLTNGRLEKGAPVLLDPRGVYQTKKPAKFSILLETIPMGCNNGF